MTWGSSSWGKWLLSLAKITTVEDTDYLLIQKNTNGDQKARLILHSDYIKQIEEDLPSMSAGGYTYGVLTNAEILALTGMSDGDNAWSTDDLTPYTYYDGSWYSVGGGVLV